MTDQTHDNLKRAIQGLIDGRSVEEIVSNAGHSFDGDLNDGFKHTFDKFANTIRELNEIGCISENFGCTYELSTDPKLDFHFDWDTTIPGVWITFSKDGHLHSTLLGFPLTNMTTSAYGPYYFGGTPPAALLIRITPNLMLFSSESNSPPAEFLEVIFTKKDPESPDIPCCCTEKRGALLDVEVNDPVAVESPASPGTDEIMGIVMNEMPDIHLVGIVTSGYPMKELIARSEWKDPSTQE